MTLKQRKTPAKALRHAIALGDGMTCFSAQTH